MAEEMTSVRDGSTAGTASYPQRLKKYLKHITRSALAAGRCDLEQVQELCLRMHDAVKLLSAAPEGVVIQQRDTLQQWPTLLLNYLDDQLQAQLLDRLDALTHALELNLAAGRTNSSQSRTIRNDPVSTVVNQIVVPPLTAEFISAIEMLTGPAATQGVDLTAGVLQHQCAEQLERYETAKGGPGLEAGVLRQCAERLELVSMSCLSHGMIGLMDIIQLFLDGLRVRAKNDVALSQTEWRCLALFRGAVSDYIRSPRNPLIIDNIITALNKLPWGARLADKELLILRNLLCSVADQPTAATSMQNTSLNPAQPAPPPRVPPEYHELIKLIATEFNNSLGQLTELSLNLYNPLQPETQRREGLTELAKLLDRYAAVADSVGLYGLQKFLTYLKQVFENNQVIKPTRSAQLWIAEWPAHVLNYLHNPFVNHTDLVAHCYNGQEFLGLKEEHLVALAHDLQAPEINLDEVVPQPRPTSADLPQVSLAVPADVHPQLLDSLLHELPQHTAEFSRAIGRIISGQGTLRDVEIAQRVAHTLKGSANTAGIAGIANLTHHIEDILTAFCKHKQLPANPLAGTLQDAADVLEMMAEELLGTGSVAPQQSLRVLQQVLDWANQIDLNGLPSTSQTVQDAEPLSSDMAIDVQDNQDSASAQTALRVSLPTIDEILRQVGESMILTSQLQESLRQVLLQNKSLYEQNARFSQLAFELEQVVDIRGLPQHLSGDATTEFDALELDQYNELHTLTRRLTETASDTRQITQTLEDGLRHIEGLVHHQGRTQKDTHEVTMKTRMLPVRTVLARLQRSSRQVCRATGKQAELIVSGESTLMDTDILNGITDPLMHILRNAVDHGIENPPIRLALGKPALGRIELSFARQGEYILIRCQDDGGGLDYAAIRRVAINKQLISATASVSNEELARLIFIPGFTTRAETTQVSGRGIGMDVAFTQVATMKGHIRVESTRTTGTLIEIRLPITLITLHGVMVQARDQVLALSNHGIERILHAEMGMVSVLEGQLRYTSGEMIYPAYYLEDLLAMPRQDLSTEKNRRPALLVKTEDNTLCVVLVEAVLNTQDLIIKQLGQYIAPIPGLEGVTILGDGRVAPVISLSGLLNIRFSKLLRPLIEPADTGGVHAGSALVMVVDDSVSVRRSLSEFMQDAGYQVITARDGIEAIEMLSAHSPDVLLIDMEMPRMNGLELTTYVRATKTLRNLPIVMITSRGSDKHRREASKAGVNAYLVKPYSENDVIGSVEAQLMKKYATN